MLLFLALFVTRLINSLSIKTFFQPDEYWQALEPAHRIAFGYGYLTWEWHEALRPSLVPMVYAAVYKLCSLLGIDVVIAPKIFQAAVAAVGDLYTAKLASKLVAVVCSGSVSPKRLARFQSRAYVWAILLTLGSALNWFCCTRTFSNTLEAVLSCAALYYWPLGGGSSGRGGFPKSAYTLSLVLASLAIVCRPPNAIFWALLAAHLVWQSRYSRNGLFVVVGLGVSVPLVLLLLVGVGLDSYFYGRVVFTLVSFVKFNVWESLSAFYGVSQWHYYLSQGLPILLIGYLPWAVLVLWDMRSLYIVRAMGVFVLVFSLLAHKEVRFMYPLLPIVHALMAVSLGARTRIVHKSLCKFALLVLFVNVPAAGYFSYIHQRGVIDVVSHIRNNPSVQGVGFLMPCHSTPWQSHLHRPDLDATSWFLTCEPPIGLTPAEIASYRDEADQFYDDIDGFLHHRLLDVDPSLWPSHLAVFEASEPEVLSVLGDYYVPETRFFNSHFHDDWRRRGNVVLLRRIVTM